MDAPYSFVVLTAAPQRLIPQLRQARMAGQVVRVERILDGWVSLNDITVPVLLDAATMPTGDLLVLLAALARRPRHHTRPVPARVLAIVPTTNPAAAQLCALCPDVCVIAADTLPLAHVRPWLRHLDALRPLTEGTVFQWLGLPPPPPLTWSSDVLPMLAVLSVAHSYAEVCHRTGISERTFRRLLGPIKTQFALPRRTTSPQALYAAILAGLHNESLLRVAHAPLMREELLATTNPG